MKTKIKAANKSSCNMNNQKCQTKVRTSKVKKLRTRIKSFTSFLFLQKWEGQDQETA